MAGIHKSFLVLCVQKNPFTDNYYHIYQFGLQSLLQFQLVLDCTVVPCGTLQKLSCSSGLTENKGCSHIMYNYSVKLNTSNFCEPAGIKCNITEMITYHFLCYIFQY